MAANTMLWYGDSGTFKTSNIGPMARLMHHQYGGITRVYTMDSGVDPLSEELREGIVQAWDMRGLPDMVGYLKLASEGYWPQTIDPVTHKANLATLCKTPAANWPYISMVVFEGLTKGADCVKGYLLGKGQATGEPLSGVFEELGQTFSSSSRGTFKFLQELILKLAENFCALPCQMTVITAHESKGEDISKKTIFGPAVAGKALTDKMTSCFQMSLHLEGYMQKYDIGEGKIVTRPGVRAFYQMHQDSEVGGIMWPAKLGVAPPIMAQIHKKWPKGYVPLRIDAEGNYVSSIATLVDFIEQVKYEREQAAQAAYQLEQEISERAEA